MVRNYDIFSGEDLKIADLILRRRMQMMVHSYIYYEMSTNLIDDKEFDRLGHELVQLQADYPEIASKVAYAEPFSDWDASTGFHLPKNEQIVRIATHLVKITRPVVPMDTSQFHTKQKPTKSSKPKKTARKSLF